MGSKVQCSRAIILDSSDNVILMPLKKHRERQECQFHRRLSARTAGEVINESTRSVVRAKNKVKILKGTFIS